MSYLLRIFSEHGQDGVGCLLCYGPLGEVVADNGCLYYTLFLRGNCRSTQVSRLIDHHSDEVVIHGCQPLDFNTVTMEVCSRRRHVPPLPCPFVQGILTVKHTVSGSRHTLLLGFSGPSGECDDEHALEGQWPHLPPARPSLFLNPFAFLPIPWASFKSSVCHEEQVNAP